MVAHDTAHDEATCREMCSWARCNTRPSVVPSTQGTTQKGAGLEGWSTVLMVWLSRVESDIQGTHSKLKSSYLQLNPPFLGPTRLIVRRLHRSDPIRGGLLLTSFVKVCCACISCGLGSISSLHELSLPGSRTGSLVP